MIFITLGSQKFQFNRLLKAVDDLVEKGIITDQILAQSGYSDYKPKNYNYIAFLDKENFERIEAKADIVITHGGTGAIIGALKKDKKVIAVPRLARYGEHVDDHQIQLIVQFREQNLICGLDDCTGLDDAMRYVYKHKFETYTSNTQKYIESIESFLHL